MDDNGELRNPYPSPPSHYLRYTDENLRLLSILREKRQFEFLDDESNIPDWPLDELEKPRVDWILEEGVYTVFGELWQVSGVCL
jgi:mediator of RNA polymerase II transcription subunit 7